MLVIELTRDKLIKIIKENKMLGKGYNGVLFLYHNNLIKLDKVLYDDIKNMEYNKSIKRIENYLKTYNFVDISQIEFLLKKQENIKLTDFDLGVVKIDKTVIGTILPNHLDYQNLASINIKNKKDMFKVLKILYNLLIAIKELDLNDINVLDLMNDLKGMNVLYKDSNIKICDLEGMFVTSSKSQKIFMYLEYEKILKEMLKRIEKINPRIIILINMYKLDENEPYESLLNFLNLLEKFLIEDVKMFSLIKEDIIFNKGNLKDLKKIFVGDLKVKEKDLNNGLLLPSDAIYGDLNIVGDGTLENIKLPKYIFGNLNISGFSKFKNVTLPLNVSKEIKIRDVKELDNVIFSNNYSLRDCFLEVKSIKNIEFPSSNNIGFYFLNLRDLDNVILPKEILYFYIPMVSSLKGIELPEKVLESLIIKDFGVLDGAIVSEKSSNYQIVTSFERVSLYDIKGKQGNKNLTMKSKYDII